MSANVRTDVQDRHARRRVASEARRDLFLPTPLEEHEVVDQLRQLQLIPISRDFCCHSFHCEGPTAVEPAVTPPACSVPYAAAVTEVHDVSGPARPAFVISQSSTTRYRRLVRFRISIASIVLETMRVPRHLSGGFWIVQETPVTPYQMSSDSEAEFFQDYNP